MTEQYLFDEYDLIEDEYLKSEDNIESYFKDVGREYLIDEDGEVISDASVYCKIEDNFYKVNIEAELIRIWQEYGDHTYRIGKITSVTWKEIPKPLPKSKTEYTYKLLMTNYQKQELENCIRDLKIKRL